MALVLSYLLSRLAMPSGITIVELPRIFLGAFDAVNLSRCVLSFCLLSSIWRPKFVVGSAEKKNNLRICETYSSFFDILLHLPE